MNGRKRTAAAVSGIGVVVLAVAAWAGVSAAVSGGGYNPDQQDCPWNADSWGAPTGTTPAGCHNVAVNVESGGTTNGNASPTNTRYVEWGNDQFPIDPNSQGTPTLLSVGEPGNTGSPHNGCLAVNTAGTGGGTGTGCGDNSAGAGFDLSYDYYQWYCPLVAAAGTPCEDSNPGTTSLTPDTGSGVAYKPILANGLLVYFGQDDNTDNGEHDGVNGLNGTDGAVNGPSDGGGMLLSITPQGALAAFSATHPEGAVNYSEGECADGICSEATTQQQTVYYGCNATNPQNNNSADTCTAGTPQNGNVFQNGAPSSTQEPSSCSSGDMAGETCSSGSSFDTYRSSTPSQMNAEPGIQTYQDPDPQRSPIGGFWMPGSYVGTCGVYFNDAGGANNPGTTGIGPGWIVDQPLGSCGS